MAVFLFLIPVITASAEMKINVDYGLNGQGKQDMPLGVTITIENDEQPFDGELLTTYPSNYYLQTGQVFPLKLAPHEKYSEFFVIDSYPYQYGQKSRSFVHVYEGSLEKGDKYKNFQLKNSEPKLYSYDTHVVGILGLKDVSKALQKLRVIKGNANLEVQYFPMDTVQTITDVRQLAFINTLILAEPLKLYDEEQLQILVSWMKNGGQLIVDQDVTFTPMKEFAALQASEGATKTTVSTQSLEQFSREGTFQSDLPLVKKDALENSELFEVDGLILAAKRPVGMGSLIQTAFSLTDPVLLTSDGYANLLAQMMNLQTPMYSNSAEIEMSNTVASVNELFPAFEFSMWKILAVLIVYILVIGPILYFILKKKDKREYAWWIIPAIAVVFSLGLFFIGARDRIAQPQIQQTAVIKVGEQSQQYFVQSLLSNRSGDYEFEFGKELDVTVYGNDFSNLHDFQNGRWSYVKNEGDKKQLLLKNVPYWDVETIVGKGAIDVGQFNVDLTNENRTLVGTITNNFDVDVTNVQIWTGAELVTIGDMKRGETTTVNKTMQLAILLPTVLPNNTMYTTPTPETIDTERKNRLIALAQSVIASEQSPAIIANAKDMTYGATLTKKATTESTTLLVQPFTATTQFTGELTLTEQAFLVSLNSEMYGGMRDQTVTSLKDWYFDPGEYEVTYKLPQQLKAEPMNWSELHYEVDESFMKAQIWNVSTNEYEPFSSQFSTQEVSNYLKQGEIRFKWTISENIYNRTFTSPIIQLKGAHEL